MAQDTEVFRNGLYYNVINILRKMNEKMEKFARLLNYIQNTSNWNFRITKKLWMDLAYWRIDLTGEQEQDSRNYSD